MAKFIVTTGPELASCQKGPLIKVILFMPLNYILEGYIEL